VSAEIDLEFTTTAGQKLGKTLTANTLCRKPVVHGQGDFVQIAASRVDNDDEKTVKSCMIDGPVLRLALDEPDAGRPKHGADDMDLTTLLKFAREDVGLELADDADEQAIMDALKKRHADGTDEIKVQGEKITKLSADLAAKSEPIKLSKNEKYHAERALSADLDALVSGHHITPACRAKLAPLLGTTVMLSIGDGQETPNYAAVVDALKDNDPAAIVKMTAEGTGDQRLSQDDDDADYQPDAETQERMVLSAGGVLPEKK
jgi:hypothetical protein